MSLKEKVTCDDEYFTKPLIISLYLSALPFIGILLSLSAGRSISAAAMACITAAIFSVVFGIYQGKIALILLSAAMFWSGYYLNQLDYKKIMEEDCDFYQYKCTKTDSGYDCKDDYGDRKIRKCIEMGFIKNNQAL